jgi:hypothetical protein
VLIATLVVGIDLGAQAVGTLDACKAMWRENGGLSLDAKCYNSHADYTRAGKAEKHA